MRHLSRVAVGSILASLCLTANARATEDLFPGQKGSTWSYAGQVNGQKVSMTSLIISATGTGLQRTLVMQWSANGRVSQEETYIVRPGEVVRSRSGANGGGTITPPLPVITYPMTVGKTWQWRGTVANGATPLNGQARLKVAAHERIQTGAGAVMAYRVDLDLTMSANGQSIKLVNSYWFAPGMGMVRQRAQLPGGVSVDAALTSLKLK